MRGAEALARESPSNTVAPDVKKEKADQTRGGRAQRRGWVREMMQGSMYDAMFSRGFLVACLLKEAPLNDDDSHRVAPCDFNSQCAVYRCTVQ